MLPSSVGQFEQTSDRGSSVESSVVGLSQACSVLGNANEDDPTLQAVNILGYDDDEAEEEQESIASFSEPKEQADNVDDGGPNGDDGDDEEEDDDNENYDDDNGGNHLDILEVCVEEEVESITQKIASKLARSVQNFSKLLSVLLIVKKTYNTSVSIKCHMLSLESW